MQHHRRAHALIGWNVLGMTERSQAAVMTLNPGESTGGPDNRHIDADQWLYVASGGGCAYVENQEVLLEMGDLLLIEAGEAHEIANPTDVVLVTINIYAPPEY